MKFYLAQDRLKGLHIVDYIAKDFSKFTLCGNYYQRDEIINFMGIDDVPPDICKDCYSSYKIVYETALKNYPRTFHTKMYETIYFKSRISIHVKYKIMGSRKVKGYDSLSRRIYTKVIRK